MNAREERYDAVVIGGGAAGIAAAVAASAVGAKTALVSATDLGGDCTWHGCVPSKTLLHAAHAVRASREVPWLGSPPEPRVDFAAVMAGVRRTRAALYERDDAPDVLARYGIRTFRAAARFVDRTTVELRGDGPARLRARWFFIATGSLPQRLALDVPVLDNETLWDLDAVPERLLIAGGGPVAIEMAQAFRALGSRVTVVARESRILVRDDEDCALVVQRQFAREGVAFAFGTEIASAVRANDGVIATLSDGSTHEADAVFAAIGRIANVAGLGLERAGVAMRDGRIRVNARCRTTAPGVYAIGDVATTTRFTHVAERMAVVAVKNAVLRWPARFDEGELTWTTFTDPELAHVGATEAQLRARGRRYDALRFPYARLDRATTDGERPGLVKILVSPRGKILGASIAGARAGETIAEIALAKKRGLGIAAISETLHAYPTYALGVRRAADGFVLRSRTGLALRALRLARGLHGTAPPLAVLIPPVTASELAGAPS